MANRQPKLTPRTIVHIDMDAFYASVEQLRQPELRGKPVIVGGSGRRGVVAAASYEARHYGVHSAMPSGQAKRLCPQAVFVAGNHSDYRQVSEQVMALMKDVTPLVEPLSLDEAFLDVTAARRLFGDGPTIAQHLRSAILASTGLRCSAGVGPNKFLAKLATEHAKPSASPDGPVPGRGVFVVEPGTELAFLHPQRARALWGVGPATMLRLANIGVVTIGDIAATDLDVLTKAVGSSVGRHLHELANGRDDRAVEPEHGAKSISQEQTFDIDRSDPAELRRELLRMSDGVAARVRSASLRARTVSIKARYGDFRTISRSMTVDPATASASEIYEIAKTLLDSIEIGAGLRLLGVGVANLEEPAMEQLSLDVVAGSHTPTRKEAERAVDEIRDRYGMTAIGPAALITPGEGLKTRTENDQRWG